jgi:hypothetical protein
MTLAIFSDEGLQFAAENLEVSALEIRGGIRQLPT